MNSRSICQERIVESCELRCAAHVVLAWPRFSRGVCRCCCCCAAALRSTWSRSMQLVFLVRALLAYKTYKQMCILLFYTHNFLYYKREARRMLVLVLLAGWHAPTIYRKYRLAFVVVVVVVRWEIYLIVSIIPEPKWERDDERKRSMCINVMSECCWINVYLFLISVWLWRLVVSSWRLESSTMRHGDHFIVRKHFHCLLCVPHSINTRRIRNSIFLVYMYFIPLHNRCERSIFFDSYDTIISFETVFDNWIHF